jgi:hypothetical protein
MQILDAELSCLPEFDEYADMDEELKKVLKELTKSTSALVHQATTSQAQTASPAQPTPRPLATVAAIATLIIVSLGAFWGVLKYTISSELAAAFATPNQQIQKLIVDEQYLRRDVDELRSQHSAEVFQHSSDSTPKEIQQAAIQLQQQGVALPRDLVINTGQSLLKTVAIGGVEKWDATDAVLSYLSFLNRTFKPIEAEQVAPPNYATAYGEPKGWTGQLKAAGMSYPPNVPQLQPLDKPDVNANVAGPAYLIMDGGTIKLDQMLMKRIIIENAHVIYGGGPLHLEKVYFVNCTFSVSHETKGEMFASAILSPDVQTSYTSSE